MGSTIVWFRRDLRLEDHEPLWRACRRGPVVPVFCLDRALLHHPETAPARVRFMLDCLAALDRELRQRGGQLILRQGNPVQVLPQLIRETGADGIYAHLDYERIYGRLRDARLNRALAEQGMRIRWFEPQGGLAELVPHSRFREQWYAQMYSDRWPAPTRVSVPPQLESLPLPNLGGLGLQQDGVPIPAGGSAPARDLLETFVTTKAERYYWQLSYPNAEVTSGLSPYLKFGTISPRDCYRALDPLRQHPDPRCQRSRKQLISRLRWGSSFAMRFRYLPQLELRSLYAPFDAEAWPYDPQLYEAWCQGRTGFPIVDAAARCLRATGGYLALNFRSRALYASFLGNLLGMDWRLGALHFMRHLIDGDCPIDHYQWAMQSGATHWVDRPWSRIYNPMQAAVDRCDPEGAFIKRWLPELERVPPERLGNLPAWVDYPPPILDYDRARRQRLETLQRQRASLQGERDPLRHLARLPADWTPVGSDRHDCWLGWLPTAPEELFPAALDLEALDQEQRQALRSWLIGPPPNVRESRHRSKQQAETGPYEQLSLL